MVKRLITALKSKLGNVLSNLRHLAADYSHIKGDKISIFRRILAQKVYQDNFQLKSSFDKLRLLRKTTFNSLTQLVKIMDKMSSKFTLKTLLNRTRKIRNLSKVLQKLFSTQKLKSQHALQKCSTYSNLISSNSMIKLNASKKFRLSFTMSISKKFLSETLKKALFSL